MEVTAAMWTHSSFTVIGFFSTIFCTHCF
jgi:hypothetical protein